MLCHYSAARSRNNSCGHVMREKKKETWCLSLPSENYIEPESWVSTDDFSLEGFSHRSVYHSKHFVDSVTGVHTQGIERARLDAKSWYKRARGNRVYLQSHLDEASWRKLRDPGQSDRLLFYTFLEDMRLSFCTFSNQ